MSTVIEDFHNKHGECIAVGQWFYFIDGAMRESARYGPMIEPPTDPAKLAKNILFFHKTRYEAARRDFESRKAVLADKSARALRLRDPGLPGKPVKEAVAELEALKKTVKKLQHLYEVAQKDYDALNPSTAADSVDANCRAEHERMLDALSKLNL